MSAPGDIIARRILVRGRVQGVFFRNWAVQTAARFGVNGWVRNRGDGSVELIACGSPRSVEEMIAACAVGPPAARVEEVIVAEAEKPGVDSFEKRPTL